MTTFFELGLSKHTVTHLEQLGFIEPTEIQTQTIGTILASRDVIGSAETGSGKTAAYALPLIERLCSGGPNQPNQRDQRVLVLVPTRELALQVRSEFQRFLPVRGLRCATVYGGCGFGAQIAELRRNPAIVVATPGRLIDLLSRGSLNLAAFRYLVLDEADRLMDLGFMPQVRKIIAQMPKERQTVMFSATVDSRIEELAKEYLRDPMRISVQHKQVEPINIEQKFYRINEEQKGKLLLELVSQAGDGSLIVFTRTRRKAAVVAGWLRQAQVEAREIHGEISQREREKTLDQYRRGDFKVLVATDIAARGLDVPAITQVINYDLPSAASDYVHRIGRTGRAGRAGASHSFVVLEETFMLRQIERLIGKKLCGPPAPTLNRGRARTGRHFAPRMRGAR